MTTPLVVEAAPADACSACGGPLDDLGRCARCGAVFGEAYRCPLCQALSDVEADAALRYRCRACGGPRVPPSAGPASEREVAVLQQARAHQLRATAYKAAAGFSFASGLLSLFVTSVVLLATSPAPLAKIIALFASSIPILLSLFALKRAGQLKKELERALEQAWLLGAGRVAAQAGGDLSARSLAQSLRIDEARAELLLAELSVQDFVLPPTAPVDKVRVTELAEPSEPLGTAEANDARGSANRP